ncbi:fas-associated death domain protein [Colletes gigas]|uniref:fas-associated death domain protein n=1 Tax=Colletes gigas TaxID=935657 RepID=UPI001C9B45D4|nr:fas-associated death domain protein [Colletes gigas]
MEAEYSCLRDKFLCATQSYIDDKILNELKKYYEHCINSKRKLSQISNLRALLKILEKRDALSYSNVEPLVYISNHFLNDPLLQTKIEDYKFRLQNSYYPLLCNMYQHTNEAKNEDTKELLNETENCTLESKEQSVESECKLASQKYVTNSKIYSNQETMLQHTVLLKISERIGRSWRDTVRYLGIPESQIDIIQTKYPIDMKEQSYEALKLCLSQYTTDNWKLNLLHALEHARRRDLKELAEKLIMCSKIE